MKNQTFAIIATSALFVYFIVTLSPVSANKMFFDVFPLSGSRTYDNGLWSTTIYLNQAVDIYAQVSYVNSGTMPPSTFIWYVNGNAVKSDVIGSSTFTFSPTTVGVYNITVTVNGEINSQFVNVTVINQATPHPTSKFTQSPTSNSTIQQTPSSTPTLTVTITPNNSLLSNQQLTNTAFIGSVAILAFIVSLLTFRRYRKTSNLN